jgi:hypothetical protein
MENPRINANNTLILGLESGLFISATSKTTKITKIRKENSLVRLPK